MEERTNCKNCGAVLKEGKCEYCKTDYEERRPKLTQAQFNEMRQEVLSVMASRGGLYASVAQAAFQKSLLQYDLSGVEEAKYITRLQSQPQIAYDPRTTVHVTIDGTAYVDTLKKKRSLWRRIWWGE